VSEWLLIVTVLWGSPLHGGEAKYVGGPHPSLAACLAASAPEPSIPRPTIGTGHRVVKVECVLRDAEANH